MSRARLSDHEAGPSVLIAALSGRALAAAARRAGYLPLVADLFADVDTHALAECRQVSRLRRAPLASALADLARGRSPVGLVCGSGFEDRPGLMHRLAAGRPLLGNTPEAVERVKDPRALAVLCERAEIPHPALTRDPAAVDGWLDKRAGAAGGWHVRPARPGAPRRGYYRQRRVAGTPVSALFVADGRRALVLGFAIHWADPAPRRPFRHGGVARPAPPGPHEAGMARAIEAITAAAGLRGLNSADFLLREDGFTMLEINPRPGASLDVFMPADPFRLHVQGARGVLPGEAPRLDGASAARVLYAVGAAVVTRAFEWPEWTADRQAPGPVADGAPLCTVLADAATADAAKSLADFRAATILPAFAA